MPEHKLVVSSEGPEARLGVLEDGALAEYFLERTRERGIAGNLYKGRVSRVLPGLQAAFIDLGKTVEKKAYLHVGDILGAGDERRLLEGYDGGDDDDEEDEDADGENGEAGAKSASSPSKKVRRGKPAARAGRGAKKQVSHSRKIEDLLKEGQEILVQIVKEAVGQKGARVTGYVSLPGRHCVLMPTIDKVGVSHRISSDGERKRLRKIVESARPRGAGFIIRTAAEGADDQEIRDDVDYLLKLWDQILTKTEQTKAPALVYADLDLVLRSVRDLLRDNVAEMVIESDEQYQRARRFATAFMPKYTERIKLYQGRTPLFDSCGIEEALRAAILRRVPLKSGGSLVIDQGEALTAIDVNTGSFIGKDDLEKTITRNNLEACDEVARQLRLRNIGGIIVVDFVDMEKEANRKLVWDAFHKALARDTTRCNVTKISELGLVEMTRKRTRESLLQMVTDACPTCSGRGVIKSTTALAHEILRELRRVGSTVKADRVLVECPPPVAEMLDRYDRRYLDELEKRFQKKVDIKGSTSIAIDQYKIEGRVVKVEEPASGPKSGASGRRRRGGRSGRRGRGGAAADGGTASATASEGDEDDGDGGDEGLAAGADPGENGERRRGALEPKDDTP
ncbi:MAG TPA: Rne/Rng family ribonuclease [Kofleriaceae bacterium]|nr:Rne/Rng family ribonuclease [Kofleriaceae bacterium]